MSMAKCCKDIEIFSDTRQIAHPSPEGDARKKVFLYSKGQAWRAAKISIVAAVSFSRGFLFLVSLLDCFSVEILG